MPYANNCGIRLYYDVEGSGAPLLLHWGFVDGGDDWRELGYVDALRNRFTVVLMDPRGQGRSDKPHVPAAYAREARVADVVAVLDAAGIQRAHYWGYSLGSGIGFAVGALVPERVRSLVLGGSHPFDNNPRPVDGDMWIEALRPGMHGLIEAWEPQGWLPWMFPGQRDRWLAADAKALLAARTQDLTQPDLPEEALRNIGLPALLYAGTRDDAESVERTARTMPNARFLPVQGADHSGAIVVRELVLPEVLAFLEQVDAL